MNFPNDSFLLHSDINSVLGCFIANCIKPNVNKNRVKSLCRKPSHSVMFTNYVNRLSLQLRESKIWDCLLTPYCIFTQCGLHIYRKIMLLLLIRTSTLTAPLYIVCWRHVAHQIFPSYNVTLLFEITSLALMPVSLSVSSGSSYQLVAVFQWLTVQVRYVLNYLQFTFQCPKAPEDPVYIFT